MSIWVLAPLSLASMYLLLVLCHRLSYGKLSCMFAGVGVGVAIFAFLLDPVLYYITVSWLLAALYYWWDADPSGECDGRREEDFYLTPIMVTLIGSFLPVFFQWGVIGRVMFISLVVVHIFFILLNVVLALTTKIIKASKKSL